MKFKVNPWYGVWWGFGYMVLIFGSIAVVKQIPEGSTILKLLTGIAFGVLIAILNVVMTVLYPPIRILQMETRSCVDIKDTTDDPKTTPVTNDTKAEELLHQIKHYFGSKSYNARMPKAVIDLQNLCIRNWLHYRPEQDRKYLDRLRIGNLAFTDARVHDMPRRRYVQFSASLIPKSPVQRYLTICFDLSPSLTASTYDDWLEVPVTVDITGIQSLYIEAPEIYTQRATILLPSYATGMSGADAKLCMDMLCKICNLYRSEIERRLPETKHVNISNSLISALADVVAKLSVNPTPEDLNHVER